MKKLLALPLIILFLSTGCASFHPQPTPKMSLEDYTYKETEQGVTVAIDPYFAPIKSQGTFDNDFQDHEMLALLMQAEVPEGNEYEITKTALTVADGGGKVLKAIDYKEAGECVGRGYGSAVAWFFLADFPGAIISAVHTASVNTRIEEDLKAREYQYGPLKSRKRRGFVYFNLECYKHKTPQEMKVNITVENIKTKEPINFSIPFAPTAGWYGDVVPPPPAPPKPVPAQAANPMGI